MPDQLQLKLLRHVVQCTIIIELFYYISYLYNIEHTGIKILL